MLLIATAAALWATAAATVPCTFYMAGPDGCQRYSLEGLQALPARWYSLKDSWPDSYVASAPCTAIPSEAVPNCVNSSCPVMLPSPLYQLYQDTGCIACGDVRAVSTHSLPGGQPGIAIVYNQGDACPSSSSRSMVFQMVCNQSAPADQGPDPLVMAGTADGYQVTWQTPLACPTLVNSSLCQVATPTLPQLVYQDWEVGVIIHYNMASQNGLQGCQGTENPPDISTFTAPALNATQQWAEAMTMLGAKYAVYVAKHGCGFTTWPSSAVMPDGSVYHYNIANSPARGRDLVGEFVASARAVNVTPGFYYSVVSNAYLRVDSGQVAPSAPVGSNQANVTQTQYEGIVVQQLRELWTKYGSLGEIWFDGGYQQDLQANITQLLNQLQPNAVAFNGAGVSRSPVRWVGTEAGQAPYPNWCTGTSNGGDPDSPVWAPAEVDTTLQNADQWFYNPSVGVRDLTTLQDVYHGSVGRNGNLLLDFAPGPDGLLPPDAMRMYQELGTWIQSCYGSPLAVTSGQAQTLTIKFGAPTTVDRVVLMEDLAKGEAIRNFSVIATVGATNITVLEGSSIGHKFIGLFPLELAVTALVFRVDAAVGVASIRRFAAHLC